MNKQELRGYFREIRRQLSESRRQEAAQKLMEMLVPYCKKFKRIASFCSAQDEIGMAGLNQALVATGSLLLPKCIGETLVYYQVLDLSSLELTKGGFLEPDPKQCEKAELNQLDLILVPGLAFDEKHFRLGYGKGHFDRFLTDHPLISTAGIGFLEQKSQRLLPHDPWDRPVETLFLF